MRVVQYLTLPQSGVVRFRKRLLRAARINEDINSDRIKIVADRGKISIVKVTNEQRDRADEVARNARFED